jgi:gliding motility-associated lipoprotein GldB
MIKKPFYQLDLPKFISINFFLGAFILFSCTSDPHNIKFAEINPQIKIQRLEEDLFQLDIDNIQPNLNELKSNYGEFFTLFNYMIVSLGNPDAELYPEYLRGFLTDFEMYNLSKEVEKVFPDLKFLEKEMNEAFSRYQYYFPEKRIPQIYSFIGGFNQSIVTTDTIIGIGLDKYLGSENPFYIRLQMAQYLRYNMHPLKISSDCMRAWALTEFEYDDSSDNLINQMIYHGRNMYFVDYMLPYQHDTLKTGFSSAQLAWCRNNEASIWTYLVEQRLLFSTDMRRINKFIGEAPFTNDFSAESPGRAAVWLGWQIVKSYMNRNKDVSLKELMEETDYQKIFNNARYKP